MSRSARPPEADAADALLEVGRTQPVLHYDVELGLQRHHQWLRSAAPLPEWASPSTGAAAKTLLPVVIKTIVSTVLLGSLAGAVWYTRSRPQPSAAGAGSSAPVVPSTSTAAPSGREPTAPDVWLPHTPLPVPISDP
ncbi:MAG: hypothetical protein ABW321_11450, partial [Polyangiales bacterium]